MNFKKVDEDQLWQLWQHHITVAGQIKRELDRRQNQPVLKVVKNRKPARHKQ